MNFVAMGLFLLPLIAFAGDPKKCDPENEEGFKQFCSDPINRSKKGIQVIPLWQGTDYPGYQLINCHKGTIKNVIEKTGESYSCYVAVDTPATYKKAEPTCDAMIEVSYLDFCSIPEKNATIGYQLVPNKEVSTHSTRKLIDCQNGIVKMLGKSGDDFSCRVPDRSVKIPVKEKSKK